MVTPTEGSQLSIEWTEISGAGVALEDAGRETARFVAPSVTGTLVFALSAAHAGGATGIDFVTITVDLENRPPVVSAGPAQTVVSLDRVILSGAADDTDGSIASLLWRQTGGPLVALSGVNGETPTFIAPATAEIATLLFDFIATDDRGASSTASTRVTVVPRVIPGNIAPMVDAGPDQTVDERTSVSLTGTATDADGRIATIAWTQLSGPAIVLTSTSTLLTRFDAPGVPVVTDLLFELAVTDDRGARVADRTRVTVRPLSVPNEPPIADAGADQTVVQNTAVTLAGGGSDPDGSIAGYAWRQVAGPAVTLSGAAMASAGFTAPPAECDLLLVFELTVTDNEGATGRDTVVVIVTAGPGPSLSMGEVLDFEDAAGGGMEPSGSSLWERGVPTSGPNRAYSGLAVWGTDLVGSYPNGAEAYLRFPIIDLTGAIDPTLSFRLWLRTGAGDGASLQVHDDILGWIALPNPVPSYDANQGGVGVWTRKGYHDRYALMSASLAAFVGRRVCVRLVFRSDAAGVAAGAYVDDASVFEETDDPDQDGIPGVESELILGTDPFRRDTDGDGVMDGAEIAAGTDPLDPAWYVGAPVLAAGTRLNFEGSRQGVATDGTLWEHGVPTAAPGRASSGSWAWATDLDADYFPEAREYLYLPRIDLRFTTDPTLSFRLWMRTGAADGLSLELAGPGMGWVPLLADAPEQEGIDPAGRVAWANHGYQSTYELAAVSLTPYVGDYVRVRLVFRSDASGQGPGVAIDDVALTEEGADPDSDGIPGVLDEMMAAGTDPFVTDTDGDGTFDGVELQDQTDPLNPAWYAGAPGIQSGSGNDFESSGGGCATTGDLWEHAVITGGPGRAHSGSWGWATRAGADYFANANEYLYLPRIDLTVANSPTLSLRIWLSTGSGDGLDLEIEDASGWTPIAPVVTAYDGLSGGTPAWTAQGYRSSYALVIFSLAPWAGTQVNARLVFRSDASGQGPGAFVDDLEVYDETDNPDRDLLLGVLDELNTYGTDPFLEDTDGDAERDGAEVTAGTDPLDPASLPAAVPLTPGAHLTFDTNRGGLATLAVPPLLPVAGSLWEYGTPTSGPGVAYNGTRVWATKLATDYFEEAREYLYLPPIDVLGMINPTLSFRLWSSASAGDGLSLEVLIPGVGWGPVVPAFPARDGTDPLGRLVWRNQGGPSQYALAAASLQLYTTHIIHLRLAFRSGPGGIGCGRLRRRSAARSGGLRSRWRRALRRDHGAPALRYRSVPRRHGRRRRGRWRRGDERDRSARSYEPLIFWPSAMSSS